MNKTLVVIGASSDMGTALIKKCGMNYDTIVAHYRTMTSNLQQVLLELQKSDKTVVELQKDLTDATQEMVDDIKKIVEEIKDSEIQLVHFPAVPIINSKFHKISWDTFQKEIDISLKSFIIVSQMLLPLMQKKKAGKIILMLSYVVENMPPKYVSDYVMIKYALLGLMKSLAVEYGDKGIQINGVSPATVDTKFMECQPEILMEKWREMSPLGRNLCVEEVTPTIEFLLSEGASCINGENILVSCGMQAH